MSGIWSRLFLYLRAIYVKAVYFLFLCQFLSTYCLCFFVLDRSHQFLCGLPDLACARRVANCDAYLPLRHVAVRAEGQLSGSPPILRTRPLKETVS